MEFIVYIASGYIDKYPKLKDKVKTRIIDVHYLDCTEQEEERYIEINSLEELREISKSACNRDLIIDFEEPSIMIYDDYVE